MKKLIIDMDDLICSNLFIERVNQLLHTSYDINEVSDFLVQNLVPKHLQEEMMNEFFSGNMYEKCVPIEDAVEVVEKLNRLYDVFIVTSYMIKGYENQGYKILYHKFNWLQKYFPFLLSSQYVFTVDKSIIKADIRIDDAVWNLYDDSEKNILFTRGYNKKVTQQELFQRKAVRVDSWKEIEEILG